MMELILKTIIEPIVVGVVLRLVDKWLNKDKQCQKRPQAYLDVSLGSFLAYDIDTILNSLSLSHSSQILSKVYILDFSSFNPLYNNMMTHSLTTKSIITVVLVLQLTVTYIQSEVEVDEATTDLFLNHIR